MPSRFLMGLDAGSGGARCLLIDVDRKTWTTAWRAWTFTPVPGAGTFQFDFDTVRAWRLLGEASREALHRSGGRPEEVLGVAACSMRHSIVLVDQSGKILAAIPNRDARAAGEAMTLGDERGPELHQRTGHWPAPIFAGPRLLWMAHEDPDLLGRAAVHLSLSDWVGYQMTGVPASEPSQAGETSLMDLEAGQWSWDVIESLGLARAIFPPLLTSGNKLGVLTEVAADDLGLPPGIPIAVGGADTQMALLGAGAVEPGKLVAVAGTTCPVQWIIDRPVIDKDARLWTGCHVMPGRWVLESNAGAMGDALEWLAKALYPDSDRPVAMLTADANRSEPGAAGVFSTFGAQVFNAREMTLPVGDITVSHLLASEDTERRRHIARAALEGLAFGLQANIDQMVAVARTGQPPACLVGGMSRSRVWAQVISDLAGAEVTVGIPESSALGAAICAGVGAGLFGSLAEGAAALSQVTRRHIPDPENGRVYRGLYGDWQELRSARAGAEALAASLVLNTITRPVDTESRSMAPPSFRPRILVTAELDEASLDALRALGEVRSEGYREAMRMLTGDELVEALHGYHVFITEIDVVDAESLNRLPDLRVVASCRGNPVNVDIAACTAYGIPVIRTPGRNADAVADLTVAFLLMLARKLPQAEQFLRDPTLEAGDMGRMGQAHFNLQGAEMWRKTVGLIGLGEVGRRVASRLKPFGVRLLVCDPYISPEDAALCGAEAVGLEQLLKESDFISLHAAVTEETRGMLGADQFASMKQGACLVNTARAALIDEPALVNALQSGRLGGAALDVFAVEPPGSDHPLLALPNVTATPHVGGNTREVSIHQGAIVVEELKRLLGGALPRHVMNREALDGFTWSGPRRAPSAEALEALRAGAAPAVSDLEIRAKPEPSPAASAPEHVEKKKSGGLFAGWRRKRDETMEPRETPTQTGDVRAAMERILRRFVEKIASDGAMKIFAAGKQVTMHFVLSDLGLDFYTAYQDGTVRADLGEPPGKKDVTLRMSADLLDGMFTGRTNPTRAAMGGKLSFSGDTMKAMSLQRIQKDLTRMYSEARAEIGDPGDLTKVGPPAPAEAKKPQTPLASPVAAKPTVAEEGDPRREIIAVLTELFQSGLITGTGGNISMRIPGRENEVWITPSQIFKGSLRPEHLVRIDLDGNPLDPDSPSASSERFVHCAILRRRPDVEAVVHSHAPEATTLGLAALPFLPISTEAVFVGEIPRVPFIMPGTTDLAERVAEALGDGVAVLMQNHGLVVAGSSLRRAADVTEIIEQTAKKIVACAMMGKQPPVLPEDIVAKLKDVGKMMV